ncbi:Hypothetical protein NTJ_11829 [Nesidiocoris tenuis]|uniref:Uncharacterized protein n=1 Tax=Nesidiocoris tenuis TaxID=355587 RepID=A0ABN7B3N6_9HEMI|nr:Hypothetical protein NTJ_11829 [Nesidiocoris tenuis]
MEENEHWPVPTPEGPRQPGNPTKEGLVVSEEPNLNLLGVNLLLKAAEAADAATVTMGDHNYTSQEKTCITLQSQDLGYPASDTRLPTVRQNGIIFKERRYLPAHGKPFILVLDKKNVGKSLRNWHRSPVEQSLASKPLFCGQNWPREIRIDSGELRCLQQNPCQ